MREAALSEDQTAELLSVDYGLTDPEIADQIYKATSGWPTLVRLYAEKSDVKNYITDEVLTPLPPEALKLLRDIGKLAPISSGLCEAIGYPQARLRLLTDAGVIRDDRVVPVVAEVVQEQLRSPVAKRHTAAKAGIFYEEHGPPVGAVRAYALAGDDEACARILRAHGDKLVAQGHALSIVDIVTRLTEKYTDRKLHLLLGDALRTTGSVRAAADAYAKVADEQSEWDAELAWRMGIVHHLRGDAKSALAAFDRAAEPNAVLLAWKSAALLQQGELAAATTLAQEAVRLERNATAQVSLALCLRMAGDATAGAELLAEALDAATKAGDVVLRGRVLTNLTYDLMCQAKYPEMLEAAGHSRECAAAAGHTNLLSLALGNEAFALFFLGRYDESVRRFERMLALCRRLGSRRAAGAHLGLGDVYRRRGWTQLARTAYETAIQLAEESSNNQTLVCALAGLSKVVADIKAAREAADAAAEKATDRVVVTALLAQGWIALRTSALTIASELANEAVNVARAERDPAGLAESLELQAAAAEPRMRKAALREALGIHTQSGAVVEAARIAYQLGSMSDMDTDERLGALQAAETLTKAGVPLDVTTSGVVIRTFGRFEVQVNDVVVPASQWQSRKARDLLRILVARRGRPVPRGELCELLWPDDDPTKTGHRLSVLLSIIKGVLEANLLVADQRCIALDITRLHIDVEVFLADVVHGRRLRDRGAIAQAYQLLVAADRDYRADVFADEPYSDFADALREEARAAHISSLRMLAQASRELGDLGASVSYLLRLLTADPYDEPGHRALIKTLTADGRHGEARRAQARYAESMRAIGVTPLTQGVRQMAPSKTLVADVYVVGTRGDERRS